MGKGDPVTRRVLAGAAGIVAATVLSIVALAGLCGVALVAATVLVEVTR